MYAVIETGGKQYRVKPGDVVQIEKIEGEEGSAVKFSQVLMAGTSGENSQIWLGKPELKGASVEGEVVGQGRGEKILIIKMKRRKQYRRTQGHRQWLSQVLVTSVDNGAGKKEALSADDKKAKLAKFQSHLRMPGPASSPKQLGTRRSGEVKTAAASEGTEKKAAAPKKAPAKKPATKKKA